MITGSADKVVDDTVEAAQTVFGDEIEAIYTLGSLAHGGFAPLVSDVDVAIVLGSTGAETADRIAEVQSMVSAKASSALAERLSLFWGDWAAVRTGEGGAFASARSIASTCSTRGISSSGPICASRASGRRSTSSC